MEKDEVIKHFENIKLTMQNQLSKREMATGGRPKRKRSFFN